MSSRASCECFLRSSCAPIPNAPDTDLFSFFSELKVDSCSLVFVSGATKCVPYRGSSRGNESEKTRARGGYLKGTGRGEGESTPASLLDSSPRSCCGVQVGRVADVFTLLIVLTSNESSLPAPASPDIPESPDLSWELRGPNASKGGGGGGGGGGLESRSIRSSNIIWNATNDVNTMHCFNEPHY